MFRVEWRLVSVGEVGTGSRTRLPCLPRYGPLGAAIRRRSETGDEEREHPPRGRFVTVDGARLHYLERGEGRPVVFLHGNVVTAEDCDLSELLDLASERQCHVVAFDRPGVGYKSVAFRKTCAAKHKRR